MKNKTLFSVVPTSVLYNEDLTAGEIVFYTKLLNLCNEDFYVDITNGKLAELVNMSADSVKKILSQLRNKKLIRTEEVYIIPYTFIATRRIHCEV